MVEVGKALDPDLVRVPRGGRLRVRLRRFGGQGDKTVLLFQTTRGAGHRVGRPYGEPVPAPEIALPADQTLTGQKVTLQARAVGGLHQSDLRQPSRQRIGRRHDRRQRHAAIRKRRRLVIPGKGPPAAFPGLRRRRRIQVVGERGAKGGLEPRLDRHILHDGLLGPPLPLQQTGERRHLRGQRRGAAFGIGARLAGFGLARFGVRARGLGLGQCLLRAGGEIGRLLQGDTGGLDIPAQRGEAFDTVTRGIAGLFRLGLVAGAGLARLLDAAIGGLMARGEIGLYFDLPSQRTFTLTQHIIGGDCLLLGFRQRFAVPLHRLSQRLRFGFEGRYGLARISVERGLPLEVPGKLRDARLEGCDLLGGAVGLRVDAVALDIETLQHRGRDGLFLAQGRKRASALSRASAAASAPFSACAAPVSAARSTSSAASRVASASRQRSQSSRPSAPRNSAPMAR
jgi:hypothetical protein